MGHSGTLDRRHIMLPSRQSSESRDQRPVSMPPRYSTLPFDCAQRSTDDLETTRNKRLQNVVRNSNVDKVDDAALGQVCLATVKAEVFSLLRRIP